jgi:hypothetical protein
LKFVKYSLVLFILINIFLVFANVINPSWAVSQINRWVESTHPSNRLLNQDVIKSTPAIALGGEVSAVVETQTPQKN